MFCGYGYVLPSYTVSTSLLLSLFIALSTRIWGWISNCNYFIHPVIWGKIVGYFTHHEGSLVLTLFFQILPIPGVSCGYKIEHQTRPESRTNQTFFTFPWGVTRGWEMEPSQGGSSQALTNTGVESMTLTCKTCCLTCWLQPLQWKTCYWGQVHCILN